MKLYRFCFYFLSLILLGERRVTAAISSSAAAVAGTGTSELRADESKIEPGLFSQAAIAAAETETETDIAEEASEADTSAIETRDVVVTFGDAKELKELAMQIQNKYSYASKDVRIYAMYKAMNAYSKKCQGDASSYLTSGSYNYRDVWSSNVMVVRNADFGCVKKLSAMKDVTFIESDKVLPMIDPVKTTEAQFVLPERDDSIAGDDQNTAPGSFLTRLTWGLSVTRVPEAWRYSSNYYGGGGGVGGGAYYGHNYLKTGTGIVVGTIDTGANAKHEALKNNFRSYAGWRDGYNISNKPVDTLGHGTHVLGTICGSGGIGVAPGAQWIACRGCIDDGCSYSALLFCCQWMLCPHDKHDRHEPETYKDCYTAPDIVSNSWGGGQGSHTLDRCALSLKAAGIIPIFAHGNDGPECQTANSPGDSPLVIGVGATDSNNNLAWFSSRGPTVEGLMKPDISAPGVAVTSAWYNATNAYVTISGTSMAAPHGAGLICLMLERCRLSYTTVLAVLQYTADRDTLGVTNQICGGTNSTTFPNNFYGAGRINALEAVRRVSQICQQNQYQYHRQNYYQPNRPSSSSNYQQHPGYYYQGNNQQQKYYGNNHFRYQRSLVPIPYSNMYFQYSPYYAIA